MTTANGQGRDREGDASADEATAILRNEHGDGRWERDYRTTGTSPIMSAGVGQGSETAAAKSQSQSQSAQQSEERNPATIRKRRKSRSRGGSAAQDGAEEEERSWWKKMVEKYGSVELENKGSVARDHLALGALYTLNLSGTCCMNVQVYMYHKANVVSLHRTYLFSMASNLPLVCIYRHCHYTTFPSQYFYIKQQRPQSF
jgi:hypothetical protein